MLLQQKQKYPDAHDIKVLKLTEWKDKQMIS